MTFAFVVTVALLQLAYESPLVFGTPEKGVEGSQLSRPCTTHADCVFKPAGIQAAIGFDCEKDRCVCSVSKARGERADKAPQDNISWMSASNVENSKCQTNQGSPCGSDRGINVTCPFGMTCTNNVCHSKPQARTGAAAAKKKGKWVGKKSAAQRVLKAGGVAKGRAVGATKNTKSVRAMKGGKAGAVGKTRASVAANNGGKPKARATGKGAATVGGKFKSAGKGKVAAKAANAKGVKPVNAVKPVRVQTGRKMSALGAALKRKMAPGAGKSGKKARTPGRSAKAGKLAAGVTGKLNEVTNTVGGEVVNLQDA